MASSTTEQNISSLNEARRNQADQKPNDGGGGPKTDSQKKLDLSEFLMWETGLTIFWLALGGPIPFWGVVANVILIAVIYIWYAGHDLNPPSFSSAKFAKIGKGMGGAMGKKIADAALKGASKAPEIGLIIKGAEMSEKLEDIIKKIPGGGTLFFILAVLSGGVGIIPTPMVLFFSIYLANK